MKKVMTALLLAGTATLGACATYDDYGYRDDDGYYRDNNDRQLRSAATGAVVGGAVGAGVGAVVDGVSPVEGAVVGAVLGGTAGAIAADNDGDGYRDDEYYDRDGNGYYDGKYDRYGKPMPIKANTDNGYRRGERG